MEWEKINAVGMAQRKAEISLGVVLWLEVARARQMNELMEVHTTEEDKVIIKEIEHLSKLISEAKRFHEIDKDAFIRAALDADEENK